MTKRKTPEGNLPQGRKKSISKASASKGREDSLAILQRRRKEGRTTAAQRDPDKLARVYDERLPKSGKDRKSLLVQKEKESRE